MNICVNHLQIPVIPHGKITKKQPFFFSASFTYGCQWAEQSCNANILGFPGKNEHGGAGTISINFKACSNLYEPFGANCTEIFVQTEVRLYTKPGSGQLLYPECATPYSASTTGRLHLEMESPLDEKGLFSYGFEFVAGLLEENEKLDMTMTKK